MRFLPLIPVLYLLVSPVSSQARTWNITSDGLGDAPTIQAGIAAASVGSTVILARGICHERDIVVKSGSSCGARRGLSRV